MAFRTNHVDQSRRACLFVVGGDPNLAASLSYVLRTASGRAPKVTVVSAASDALWVVSRERVRAVLVEHRPAGGLSEQSVRALVHGARGRPVVWLIEEDDVVEIAEAVAAGVSGAYYWDQVGPDLLSAMDRLALSSADRASPEGNRYVAAARLVSKARTEER